MVSWSRCAPLWKCEWVLNVQERCQTNKQVWSKLQNTSSDWRGEWSTWKVPRLHNGQCIKMQLWSFSKKKKSCLKYEKEQVSSTLHAWSVVGQCSGPVAAGESRDSTLDLDSTSSTTSAIHSSPQCSAVQCSKGWQYDLLKLFPKLFAHTPVWPWTASSASSDGKIAVQLMWSGQWWCR